MSRRQLAVGITELHDSGELARGELIGQDAVIARLLDHVFGALGLLEVNGFRFDDVLRLRRGFLIDDELANVRLIAVVLLNKCFLANADFLVETECQPPIIIVLGLVERGYLTFSASGVSRTPIKSSSFHSNMTKLTVGS